MTRRFTSHVRAHLIGYLALFIALGGTASALSGKNNLDRNDFRRAVVTTRALAPNAVKTRKIANGHVRGADVKESTLNFSCTGGRVEAAGACYDGSNRTAGSWQDALDDCADEAGRLPSLTELAGAAGALNVTPAADLWTDAYWDDGGTARAAALRTSTLLPQRQADSNSNAYRCVFPLVK